jgi:hypothetical protein
VNRPKASEGDGSRPAAWPDDRPTHSDDGVDLTLIRWMLSLTPSERLAVLQSTMDSIRELRGHGAEAGRDKDRAVLAILRRTLEEKKR